MRKLDLFLLILLTLACTPSPVGENKRINFENKQRNEGALDQTASGPYTKNGIDQELKDKNEEQKKKV